jgi:4-amino-4-deoxy-L-arabinose transferase-like glycosyltransferase
LKRKLLICLFLFIASFAVRFLVWQNNKLEMATVQSVVTENYLRDARALASGDVRMFVTGPNPPSNARVIDHPPGFPLMIGIVYAIAGEGDTWHIFQLALNSLAAVLLFLIAAELFNERVGIIAGVLATLSPQLAYHSGLLLPDELSVIPVLGAVYFFVRMVRRPRGADAVLCGLCLGISCWLRSNALLLPFFFGGAAFMLNAKRSQLLYSAILLAAFAIGIAPITARNIIFFDAPVPLSLGFGTTFVEGLGDIDDGSRGLPRTDENVMALDQRLDQALGDNHGTPYTSLYDPNGVERDAGRMAFGRSVVAQEPLWFFGGVAARGLSTFRLERVPAIAPERDERGTTPTFLYWLDRPLKFLQRAFVTALFLPLALIGLVVIAIRKQWRTLIVILIVPLYYATVQPLVHTEYRYVLATPHMLIITVAFALCWLFGRIVGLLGRNRERAAEA